MGMHPNAMIQLIIYPNSIPEEYAQDEDFYEEVEIDGHPYEIALGPREDETLYIEDPDTIVIYTYLCYGWGETCDWSYVEAKKLSLENYGRQFCKEYGGVYYIKIACNFC